MKSGVFAALLCACLSSGVVAQGAPAAAAPAPAGLSQADLDKIVDATKRSIAADGAAAAKASAATIAPDDVCIELTKPRATYATDPVAALSLQLAASGGCGAKSGAVGAFVLANSPGGTRALTTDDADGFAAALYARDLELDSAFRHADGSLAREQIVTERLQLLHDRYALAARAEYLRSVAALRGDTVGANNYKLLGGAALPGGIGALPGVGIPPVPGVPGGVPNLPVPIPEIGMGGTLPSQINTVLQGKIGDFWAWWSTGLFISRNFNKPVDGATLVPSSITGGQPIVRVQYGKQTSGKFGLEAHRFVKGWTFGDSNDIAGAAAPHFNSAVAWGPMVMVIPGGTEVLDGAGLGLVLGVLGDSDYGKSGAQAAMNIGLGYLWDFNVQRLEEHFEDNQPLPVGETEVRFKKTTQGAIVLTISFGISTPKGLDRR